MLTRADAIANDEAVAFLFPLQAGLADISERMDRFEQQLALLREEQKKGFAGVRNTIFPLRQKMLGGK